MTADSESPLLWQYAKMNPAKAAGFSAILTSVGTLFATLCYVPPIVVKITYINEQMKNDAEEVRLMMDEAWDQLTASSRSRRHIRQVNSNLQKTYYLHSDYIKVDSMSRTAVCVCDEWNLCPPGPPGPHGEPGRDGNPGIEGLPGAPGLPGNGPPVTIDTDAGCRVCPRGPRGPNGPPGQVGLPGEHGIAGESGKAGDLGRTGYQGSPGISGEVGNSGKMGEPGIAGRSGIRGLKSLPGVNGKAGIPGIEGSAGYPGPDGQPGHEGQIGLPGDVGFPGMVGQKGQQGSQGAGGSAGNDADYCGCSPRTGTAGVDKATNLAHGHTNSQQVTTTMKSRAQSPAYEPIEVLAASTYGAVL